MPVLTQNIFISVMPSKLPNMLSHHLSVLEPVVTGGGASTGVSTGLGTDWSLLAPVLTEKTLSKMPFLLEKNLSHYWRQY